MLYSDYTSWQKHKHNRARSCKINFNPWFQPQWNGVTLDNYKLILIYRANICTLHLRHSNHASYFSYNASIHCRLMLRRVWTRLFPCVLSWKFQISSSHRRLFLSEDPFLQHCLTHVFHSRNVYTHSYMCTLRHHRHCRSHMIRCNIISKTYLPNRKLLQPRCRSGKLRVLSLANSHYIHERNFVLPSDGKDALFLQQLRHLS